MRYELFYLVGVSKELELEKIKTDVDGIVTSHGGVFEEKMTEEKRRMAYKIKKDTHGVYIAKRFTLEETSAIPEIISKLNLLPGVLRFILSDASELPELKTKEERIEQEQRRSEIEKMRQEKREAAQAEKNPPKEAEVKTAPAAPETVVSEEEKKESAEAIDKKLEEILNI